MTDLERARMELDALNATIKRLEAKEKKAKRPELAKGQVWKHAEGTWYLCVHDERGTDFRLVCVANGGSYHIVGNYWNPSRAWGDGGSAFTYIGMASEVLTTTEKAK